MAFFPGASDLTISGGTFTSHVQRIEGKKGTLLLLFCQRLDHDTTYLTQGGNSSQQESPKGHYTTLPSGTILPNVTHVLGRPF